MQRATMLAICKESLNLLANEGFMSHGDVEPAMDELATMSDRELEREVAYWKDTDDKAFAAIAAQELLKEKNHEHLSS